MKKGGWKSYTPGEKVLTVGYFGLIAASIGVIIQSYDRQVKIDWTKIPVIGFATNGNPLYWSPQPLATELAENLQGVNLLTYPETVRKINVLNNEQVKLLWNYYNKFLVRSGVGAMLLGEGRTLTSLIDNEWTDWGGDYERAVARFKSLGLY